MTLLMDVADAAATTVSGWFPEGTLRHVGVHAGSFTEKELDRLSSATPAIYLALIRTHDNDNAGAEDWSEGDAAVELPPVRLTDPALRDVVAEYVASVVARPEGTGKGADRVAEAIATELLRRVPEQRWGLTGLNGATRVRLQNRFNQALAERQLALWTVEWRQEIRLGSPWPAGQTPTTLCVSVGDDAPMALEA